MDINSLIDILKQDKPSQYIISNEDYIFKIIPELSICKGFHQNNIWHIHDVYNHILHVVDGVPNNITLRLAALFHDVGKPYVYKEDEDGIGHFYNHWNKSKEIFENFAQKHNIDNNIKSIISNLILYHDINIDKINNNELKKLLEIFNEEEIKLLFQLKRSDLLAQNTEFHYLLECYKKQEIKILTEKKN